MAGDLYDYTRFGLLSIASDGVSVSPPYAFSSETSLGFFRSANSTVALSYGTLSLPGNLSASGALSGTTLTLTKGLTVGGGQAVPVISSTSSLVAAFVVQGSASSFTIITWAAVAAHDQIITTVQESAAVSSLSSGLVLHSHCTQAGQFEFRLSNVSTLAQNQSSRSYIFTLIRPF